MKYSSFAFLFSKICFFGGLVSLSCILDVPNQTLIRKNKKDEKITVVKNGYLKMKDIELFEKVEGCKLIFQESGGATYNARDFYEKKIKAKKPDMTIDLENGIGCKNGEYLNLDANPFLKNLEATQDW